MRIVVATEPRCYRETIAGAFAWLRPNDEVITVEPNDLEREVVVLEPDMVLCSAASPVIAEHGRTWVILRNDINLLTEISIGGERTSYEDIQLAGLLAIADRTALLVEQHRNQQAS